MKRVVASMVMIILMLQFLGCTKQTPLNDTQFSSPSPPVSSPLVQQSPPPDTAPDNSVSSPTEPSAVYYDRGYVPTADPIEEGMSAPEGMIALKEIPKDYSLEQAISDGCIVYSSIEDAADMLSFTDFRFTHGEDVFETFKEKVHMGESACVRIFREYSVISVYPPVYVSEVYDLEHRDGAFITRRWMRDDTACIEYEKKCTYTYPSEDGLVTCYNNDPDLAAADGCPVLLGDIPYVSENTDSIVSGYEIWKCFLEKVNAGQSASIRIANLYPSSSDESQPLKYPDPDVEFSLFVFDIEYDGREYTYRYFDSETGMVTAEEYSVLIRLLKAPTAPDGVYALMFTEEFDLYEIRDFSLDVSPLSYRPDIKYIFAVPRGTE